MNKKKRRTKMIKKWTNLEIYEHLKVTQISYQNLELLNIFSLEFTYLILNIGK